MARKTRGVGIIFQGVPGIGKSGLAAHFPGPILCVSCKEVGFDDLIDSGEIDEDSIDQDEAEDWNDLLSILDNVGEEYKTVVIDSLSGVSQFMGANILKVAYNGDVADFGSFSNGWRIQGPIWTERLETRLTLLRSKGVNVILVGHVKSETEKDPLKNDYQRLVLDMDKNIRPLFLKWAQAVLFLTMEFDLKVSKMWKKKATEHKVDSEEEVDRVIYTEIHPSHDAKNRLDLPPVIEMGDSAKEAYNNLISKFPPKIQQHLGFNKDE